MDASSFTIHHNWSLKELTRIKVGGRCSYYCEPVNVDQVKKAICYAGERGVPAFIMGGGSNLLVGDGQIDFLVIRLKGAFKKYSIDGSLIRAGGGVSLIRVGLDMARKGFLDYQFMAHIPGTIGGAVAMNAGTTKEGEIKDCFLSAEVLDIKTGQVSYLDKESIEFSYRSSSLFGSSRILLEACFNAKGRREIYPGEAMGKVRQVGQARKMKQPRNPRNFGSIFKRPDEGKAAGWYLEQVGMKGEREGDALVPEEHANWVVNLGEARFSDVKKLVDLGHRRVYEKFGVFLKREVIFFPELREAA